MEGQTVEADYHQQDCNRSSIVSGTPSETDINDQTRSSITNFPPWTAADDDVLASARAAGLNWQPIATKFFPSKTANACRKRHERLMERRHQDDWEGERLEQLSQVYFDCRKEMWSLMAARLGERWSLVESKCMEKGLKNLQTFARQSQRKRRRVNPNDATANMTSSSYSSSCDMPDPEDDSGVGLSDAEIDLLPNNRPRTYAVSSSSSSSVSSAGKRSISPYQSTDDPRSRYYTDNNNDDDGDRMVKRRRYTPEQPEVRMAFIPVNRPDNPTSRYPNPALTIPSDMVSGRNVLSNKNAFQRGKIMAIQSILS